MSDNLMKLDAAKLKELGVDFRVTKNELIDTIIDEQLENISEEKKEVRQALKDLREKMYSVANLKKVVAKRDIPAYMRTFLKHCEMSHTYCHNAVDITFTPPRECGMYLRYHDGFAMKATADEFPQYEEVKKLEEEYTALQKQEYQLRQGTNKVRRLFLRQILASSEAGKELVKILDSYKAPRQRKAKALAASSK